MLNVNFLFYLFNMFNAKNRLYDSSKYLKSKIIFFLPQSLKLAQHPETIIVTNTKHNLAALPIVFCIDSFKM